MLGERLKKAVSESRLTADEVASGLGVSKSNLYVLYKKESFELEYVKKASQLLGLSMSYFLDEERSLPTKPNDGGAFGSAVLQEIREEMRMLREQLSVKDSQIAGLQESQKSLQDMLKLVLGKFKGVTFTQLSEEEVFELRMGLYKYAGLNVSLSALAGKPRRVKMPTRAKSVALSLT